MSRLAPDGSQSLRRIPARVSAADGYARYGGGTRTPLGTTGVSASEGTVELVGRRGADWARIATTRCPLFEAIAELDTPDQAAAHADPAYDGSISSSSPSAPRFAIGQQILWRYGRVIETARVVCDDDRGWDEWMPDEEAKAPLVLPSTAAMAAARARLGMKSFEG